MVNHPGWELISDGYVPTGIGVKMSCTWFTAVGFSGIQLDAEAICLVGDLRATP